MTENLAVEVAAVLEEFSAAERARGVTAARMQKLVFQRQVGEGAIVFEAVIDETADAKEIYAMLERVEAAADRLKAKVDLSGHYGRILNNIALIEQARKRLAEETVEYEANNAAANRNRRTPIILTDAQSSNLKQHRTAIKDCFDKIEETQKAISECRRVLDGDDPFQVLSDQIAERLDAVRGSRSAAA
jgi:hypothetical protein